MLGSPRTAMDLAFLAMLPAPPPPATPSRTRSREFTRPPPALPALSSNLFPASTSLNALQSISHIANGSAAQIFNPDTAASINGEQWWWPFPDADEDEDPTYQPPSDSFPHQYSYDANGSPSGSSNHEDGLGDLSAVNIEALDSPATNREHAPTMKKKRGRPAIIDPITGLPKNKRLIAALESSPKKNQMSKEPSAADEPPKKKRKYVKLKEAPLPGIEAPAADEELTLEEIEKRKKIRARQNAIASREKKKGYVASLEKKIVKLEADLAEANSKLEAQKAPYLCKSHPAFFEQLLKQQSHPVYPPPRQVTQQPQLLPLAPLPPPSAADKPPQLSSASSTYTASSSPELASSSPQSASIARLSPIDENEEGDDDTHDPRDDDFMMSIVPVAKPLSGPPEGAHDTQLLEDSQVHDILPHQHNDEFEGADSDQDEDLHADSEVDYSDAEEDDDEEDDDDDDDDLVNDVEEEDLYLPIKDVPHPSPSANICEKSAAAPSPPSTDPNAPSPPPAASLQLSPSKSAALSDADMTSKARVKEAFMPGGSFSHLNKGEFVGLLKEVLGRLE